MNQTLEDNMKDLFETAEREGLWFFCGYQQIWQSPKELRKNQTKGNFRWGAVNWELRSPIELKQELENKIRNAKLELERFWDRMTDAGVKDDTWK